MTFQTLKRTKQKYGTSGVLKILNYSLRNKVGFYKELQGLTVTMDTLDHSYLKGDPKYTFRFLTHNELHHYANNAQNKISKSFLDKAFSKGDFCYAVLEGSKLASYGWYSSKPTLINKELELIFDPKWIYMYKGYTLPEFRGQRLHAIGMARSLADFSKKGYKGIISYVETNNFASLSSCSRMGYTHFGKVEVKKVHNSYKISADLECKNYNFTVKTV